MPKGKTPMRSQRLRNSPALTKTPGWTAASEDLFCEPLQTPSPFKNRVLTRRTSVYVKNIYKARGLEEIRNHGVQETKGNEKYAARNTRKQTSVKKIEEVTMSPLKSKSTKERSISSKSENSVTNLRKRKSGSPANSKVKSLSIEESQETVQAKALPRSKKTPVSPKINVTSIKPRESIRPASRNSKQKSESEAALSLTTEKSEGRVASKSPKPAKTKSPKSVKAKVISSPVKKKSRQAAKSIKQLASESKKLNVSREKNPSSIAKKPATPKVQVNQKQQSQGKLDTPTVRTPSAVTPYMIKSKTETFSTPHGTPVGLTKSKTTSLIVKSRTPMAESPRLGRKTVRISESEKTTPRTPIHRQATPGRLNVYSQAREEASPAFQSVTKKRKMTAVTTPVQSVTPIKAAKILGKIIVESSAKKLPKKPKSVSPHTSTPASGLANKRPAMAVPPVSEIRRSKRTKRGAEGVVSIEEGYAAAEASLDVCITSLKTPEKKREAIEAIAVNEHSKAMLLASEGRDSWWGYCNIL